MPQVAIVIPNLNQEKLLRNCLQSLNQQIFTDFVIYVVDNGSIDNSVQMIKTEFPQVNVIELETNTGFAYASNQGIIQAVKDYQNHGLQFICPLNNDIELDPNYLKIMAEAAHFFLAQEIKFGVLASKLLFKHDENLINTVGTLIQRDGSGMEKGFMEKDQGQYDQIRSTFGSCAAAALYNLEMLEQIKFTSSQGINYFDNDFFAYYEDLDLNYRSRLLGYRAYFIPKAFGYHVHSATGRSFSAFKSFHVHRNQYFVLIKNFPWPFLILGLCLQPFRYFLLLISAFIGRGPSAELKKNTRGFEIFKIVFKSWYQVLKELPDLLKKRKQILKSRKVTWRQFNSWFKKYKASYKKMIFGS
ncbi:MAG: glycosyltransferase [Candidatus Moranbacteria bacterium]|nr:glycosyltransferase [Candidatus Moranbacteria bacterium]